MSNVVASVVISLNTYFHDTKFFMYVLCPRNESSFSRSFNSVWRYSLVLVPNASGRVVKTMDEIQIQLKTIFHGCKITENGTSFCFRVATIYDVIVYCNRKFTGRHKSAISFYRNFTES